MTQLVDEHDPDADQIGHICIYLFDTEIHIDLQAESDGSMPALTDLAEALGELVTAAIIRELSEIPDADVIRPSIQ